MTTTVGPIEPPWADDSGVMRTLQRALDPSSVASVCYPWLAVTEGLLGGEVLCESVGQSTRVSFRAGLRELSSASFICSIATVEAIWKLPAAPWHLPLWLRLPRWN